MKYLQVVLVCACLLSSVQVSALATKSSSSLHSDNKQLFDADNKNLEVSEPLSQSSLKLHDRRTFFQRTTYSTPALLLPLLVKPTRATAEDRTRSIDVGGGTDLLVDTRNTILSNPNNIVFAGSLEGTWACQRVVVSVEGDLFQAQTAYQALGGTDANLLKSHQPELFQTRLMKDGADYAVVDRRYEYLSRAGRREEAEDSFKDQAQWSSKDPNVLTLPNGDELAVVQRSVLLPNPEQGVVAGGQELVRATQGPFVRAALVKQRFRTAADGSGDLEGLELVKTFRVLDGVAGTELPTSTTKSTLRWHRIE